MLKEMGDLMEDIDAAMMAEPPPVVPQRSFGSERINIDSTADLGDAILRDERQAQLADARLKAVQSRRRKQLENLHKKMQEVQAKLTDSSDDDTARAPSDAERVATEKAERVAERVATEKAERVATAAVEKAERVPAEDSERVATVAAEKVERGAAEDAERVATAAVEKAERVPAEYAECAGWNWGSMWPHINKHTLLSRCISFSPCWAQKNTP